MKLSDAQIARLLGTKICFTYDNDVAPWIKDGIISIPKDNVFAEDYSCYFMRSEFFTIGAFSYSWSAFPEFVSIGRYCSIGGSVSILPISHQTNMFTTSSLVYHTRFMPRAKYYEDMGYDMDDGIGHFHPTNNGDVIIGHDVYIGEHVTLRRGINIGDGAIIGSRAVITKDVPPYAVVVGNPGRIVRFRYSDKQIASLNDLKWWDFDFKTVQTKTHHTDMELFIDRMTHLIDNKEINRFRPSRNYIGKLISQ
ncbi:CatB-related O-acetyltransferase [Methylobacterium sp. E-005]|uniref:CatB-related O-acetyltransferase n=1 Tax=Methylobacterium sp. E-005 TaxID=2836549 RepID=UPI001FB97513|nr:CatB-related O-acetyltransferase [Methylobacterium sp. E-005]MCJ2086979.1 CatB-related O-acetyltransferase [Methylobacterium sp. E-005]